MTGSSRAAALLLGAVAAVCLCSCGGEAAEAVRRIDARVASLARRADQPASTGGLDAYRVILDADPNYAAGAELIARALNGSIVKLDLTAFGDLGRLEDSYAFTAGKLMWARKKLYRLSDASAGMRLESLKTWYFQDGKVIRMADGVEKKILVPSASLRNQAQPIQDEADRLSRLAYAAINAESP